MKYWKVRLFALVIILVSALLVYFNWQQMLLDTTYSIQTATFGPMCVVGGIFLLLFPTNVGKPETPMQKIFAVLMVIVGLAAGLINWYLMDPGFFGM